MKNPLIVLFLLASLGTAAQDLFVGAAQAPINPAIPSYIAGHTQNRKFSGIHDSLFVKAVAISNGKDNIVIITVDCIGLLYPQLEQIREKVAATTKEIRSSQIVLSSTHTHSGPDVVGLWGPDLMHSGVDSGYISFLVNTAADQVVKAWQRKKRARMVYGFGTHGEGWVQNISEPRELDRSLTTIQFRDKKGRSIATLTNFACHPTFLDAVHHEVSADYPHGFYVTMEEKLGGVNLFLQGAIGGWVQPEGEPQTFEQAFKRGSELALATVALLQKASPVRGQEIEFRSSAVDMPISNMGFRQLAKAGVIKRDIDTSARTEIAMFRIGNAFFATHPGETVPAMGLATKALMKTDGPKMVMGLSMDAIGYILKPEFFDESRNIPHSKYLCSMSAGPASMKKVMDTINELSTSITAVLK